MRYGRPDWDRVGPYENEEPIDFDEPVFLLRAQDVTSSAIVRAWIALNKKLGATEHTLRSAERVAEAMEDWPHRKLADMPIDATAELDFEGQDKDEDTERLPYKEGEEEDEE